MQRLGRDIWRDANKKEQIIIKRCWQEAIGTGDGEAELIRQLVFAGEHFVKRWK